MWPCARLSVASGRFCPADVGRATGGEAAVTRRAEQGVMRRRSIMVFASPRQSILGPRPAPGLAPPASACPGGPRPVGGPGCSDLQGTVPPGEAKAPSPLDWQGPSPLPQRPAGIRTSRGPKPPASARPAHDGRFAPAGSGAGLCPSRTCRSTGHRPARAGETRIAFPGPARTDESAVTASMAGAIAPATAPR